jgi:hypothetical protein
MLATILPLLLAAGCQRRNFRDSAKRRNRRERTAALPVGPEGAADVPMNSSSGRRGLRQPATRPVSHVPLAPEQAFPPGAGGIQTRASVNVASAYPG